MIKGRRFLSRFLVSESFLIGILRLIGLISWPRVVAKRRGKPYVYSPLMMLRCFVVRVWLRIPSNNALHSFFLLSAENPYNAKVMTACGLDRVPDRRTFDRRLDSSRLHLEERIDAMGRLFIEGKFVDPYIVAVDSTLLKAKGNVWHRSCMEKGVVTYPGIDTDARWGKSHSKGGVGLRVQAPPREQHGQPDRPALGLFHDGQHPGQQGLREGDIFPPRSQVRGR